MRPSKPFPNGADSDEVLLDVRDLFVEFRLGPRVVHAVNGVNLSVKRGETLVVLGESGSGKSITFEAVTGILDVPPGRVTAGRPISRARTCLTCPRRSGGGSAATASASSCRIRCRR